MVLALNMWRKVHRWVAVVAAVFLLNLAVTGLLMNLDELRLVLRGEGPDTLFAPPQALPEADWSQLLARGSEAARALVPVHTMTALRLSVQNGVPKVQATFVGPQGGDITINAQTGERMAGPPGPSGRGASLDRYQFLKRLHRGDFIGSFHGRYLSIVAGLAMYSQLRRRRYELGRSSWFWL
jgi:uncharacterized iron-regulated membrane protein